MISRRRRQVRLVILLAVLVAAVGAAWALYGLRRASLDRAAFAAKDRADAFFAEGKYAQAVESYGVFFRRFKDDAGAMHRYGKALREVEMPGGRHLMLSLGALQRASVLDPALPGIRRELMELYGVLGMATEQLTEADRVLSADPQDAVALRERTRALLALNRLEEARAAAERLLARGPGLFENQMLVLLVMSRQERSGEEITARAAECTRLDPDVPAARLLRGHAAVLAKDLKVAGDLLRPLAEETFAEERQAALLAADLERLGEVKAALAVLARATEGRPRSVLYLALVERMWERRDYAGVVGRVDAAEKDGRALTPGQVALRTLSLLRLDRQSAAAASLEAFSRCPDTAVAASWRDFLEATEFGQEPSPRARVDVCIEALAKLEGNPIVEYALGRAYEDLREPSLAVKAYAEASNKAPLWAEPLVRAARALLAQGRPQEAIPLGATAWRIDPEHPDLPTLWLAIASGMLPKAEESALKRIEEGLAAMAAGSLAARPAHARALARLGREEEARQVVRDLLAETAPVPGSALLDFAALGESLGMDAAEAFLQRYEREFGLTPELALFRARRRLATDGTGGALAMLDAARDASAEPQGAGWLRVRAALLETAGDDRAGEAWRAAADAAPGDLDVQHAVLASPAAWKDPALVDRVVERVRAGTGDSGLVWRAARAHRLLADPASDAAARVEARGLLEGVLKDVPSLTALRLTLARLLVAEGDTQGAVDQLTQAVAAGVEGVQVLLELAGLHQAQGDYARARERLQEIARRGDLSAGETLATAVLHLRQGEREAAVALLDRPETDWGALSRSGRLALARARGAAGDLTRSEALVADLLQAPDQDTLFFAAELYLAQGRVEAAEKAFAALEGLPLTPAAKALFRAEHWRSRGDAGKALAHYREVIAAAPADEAAWRRALGALAAAGFAEEVVAGLGQSKAALPAGAALPALAEHADLLGRSIRDAGLREAAVALLEDPGAVGPVAEALQVACRGQDAGETPADVARRLDTIAERHPRVFAVQALAMEWHGRAGDVERLAQVADRTRSALPANSDGPRILATALGRGLGRWAPALAAARDWQARAGERALAPALFMAECHLNLKQPAEAAKAIEPWLEEAREAPDRYGTLLGIMGRALVLDGRVTEAEALFADLLPGSPVARTEWLALAAEVLPDTDVGVRWLALAAPHAASASERLVVAASRASLAARRPGDSALAQQAREGLAEFSAAADLSPLDNLRLAMSFEALNDDPAAETAYRRVLAAEPSNPPAANNLAMILLRKGDTAAALDLAKTAVTAAPQEPEFHDTLAQVLRRVERLPEAITEIRTCRSLASQNPRWTIVLLEHLLLAEGTETEARGLLSALDRFTPEDLPSSYATRLTAVRDQWSRRLSK